MRLAITGGGTGGHVFPALEVARLAGERGHDLRYFGSRRGQEGPACDRLGISFEGFVSEPLYNLRTLRGVRAGWRLMLASSAARKALREWQPTAVFSTGGYSAAPVVNAARRLGIPYVLLETNSVPGRSNALFARQAKAICVVFEEAATHFQGSRVVRTGMPIRRALRMAAEKRHADPAFVLAVGGSQGSEYLNALVPKAARAMKRADVSWLHVSGKAHFAEARNAVEGIPNFCLEPFLEADALAEAYGKATVIVCRSGGSLAEVALYGIPAVLIPLPSSAGNHQLFNARAFAAMGAASVCEQRETTAESLAAEVAGWLDDPDRQERAAAALRKFDVPDATERILALLEGVA